MDEDKALSVKGKKQQRKLFFLLSLKKRLSNALFDPLNAPWLPTVVTSTGE